MISVTIGVSIKQCGHSGVEDSQHYISEYTTMNLEPANFNSVMWYSLLGRTMAEVVRRFNDKVYSEEDAIPSK